MRRRSATAARPSGRSARESPPPATPRERCSARTTPSRRIAARPPAHPSRTLEAEGNGGEIMHMPAILTGLLLFSSLPLLAADNPQPATTNNNDSCDVAVFPAATLLIAYFEVDTSAPR